MKKDKRTELKKEIDAVTKRLAETDELSKEYPVLLEYLGKLTEVYAKCNESKKSISPDTIAIIAANIVGILLILNYEKLGVVSSKALAFIIRGRV